MRKRLRIAFLLFLVVALAAFWYLLRDNRPDRAAQVKPVTIAQLRSLAASIPGQAPQGFSAGLIAIRKIPSDYVSAGSGLRRQIFGVMAFRFEVPGGAPIVIEGGMQPQAARENAMSWYSAAAQQHVSATVRRAGLILTTSERDEHLQGLLDQARTSPVLARMRLNPGQVPSAPRTASLRWPPHSAVTATIGDHEPQAIAPGVVVIPTPGVTPGSQMIYLREAGGREFLFPGDIAPFADNWKHQRARSRLRSAFGDPEGRQEVYDWLATIARMNRDAPDLAIVAPHDMAWLFLGEERPEMLPWPQE